MVVMKRRTYIPRNSSGTGHDTENLHTVKLTSVLGEVDRVNSQTGQGIWVLNFNTLIMGRILGVFSGARDIK